MGEIGHLSLLDVRFPLIRVPPPPPQPTMLNTTAQAQEQTFWCWAATGVSVSGFYDQTVYSQCAIVTAVFKAIDKQNNTHVMDGIDCCDPHVDASKQPCNGESGADRAMDTAHKPGAPGHFDRNGPPLSFEDVTLQIDRGRPVACEITWADNSGNHFVLISGYGFFGDPAVESVFVQDPGYAMQGHATPAWYQFDKFVSQYDGQGTYTATTLSKP